MDDCLIADCRLPIEGMDDLGLPIDEWLTFDQFNRHQVDDLQRSSFD
jgi:hypothetical protein